MLGQNFPISEYYRKNIVDAVTLTRGGGWWTAILLIKEPQIQTPYISLYKWKFISDTNEWKTIQSYKINNKKNLNNIIQVLNDFSNKLEE